MSGCNLGSTTCYTQDMLLKALPKVKDVNIKNVTINDDTIKEVKKDYLCPTNYYELRNLQPSSGNDCLNFDSGININSCTAVNKCFSVDSNGYLCNLNGECVNANTTNNTVTKTKDMNVATKFMYKKTDDTDIADKGVYQIKPSLSKCLYYKDYTTLGIVDCGNFTDQKFLIPNNVKSKLPDQKTVDSFTNKALLFTEQKVPLNLNTSMKWLYKDTSDPNNTSVQSRINNTPLVGILNSPSYTSHQNVIYDYDANNRYLSAKRDCDKDGNNCTTYCFTLDNQSYNSAPNGTIIARTDGCNKDNSKVKWRVRPDNQLEWCGDQVDCSGRCVALSNISIPGYTDRMWGTTVQDCNNKTRESTLGLYDKYSLNSKYPEQVSSFKNKQLVMTGQPLYMDPNMKWYYSYDKQTRPVFAAGYDMNAKKDNTLFDYDDKTGILSANRSGQKYCFSLNNMPYTNKPYGIVMTRTDCDDNNSSIKWNIKSDGRIESYYNNTPSDRCIHVTTAGEPDGFGNSVQAVSYLPCNNRDDGRTFFKIM